MSSTNKHTNEGANRTINRKSKALYTKTLYTVAIPVLALALVACGGKPEEIENRILEGGFAEGDSATMAIPVAVHTANMLNDQYRIGHSQLLCTATGCVASGSATSNTLTIKFEGYTSGYSSFKGEVVVDSSGVSPILTTSNLKTTVYTQFAQKDHDITLSGIELNPSGVIEAGAASLDGAVQSLDKLRNDQGVFISYATLVASYALVGNVSRICSGESCTSKDRLHTIVTKVTGNGTTLSQTRDYNMTSITKYINNSMGDFQLQHSSNTENRTQNKLRENLANNDVYLKYDVTSTSGNADLDTTHTEFNNIKFIKRESKYQRNETLINLKGRALYKDGYVTFIESTPQCTHNTKAFHVVEASAVPQNIAKQYEEYGKITYLQTDLSGDGNSDITLIIKNTFLDRCDSGEPIFQIIGPVDGLVGGEGTLTNTNVNGGEPWRLDELFLNVYYDPYISNNTANISSYYYR